MRGRESFADPILWRSPAKRPSQLFHHLGGEAWDQWNTEMRDLLVNIQEKRGTQAGSWSPDKFKYGRQGGRIYTTALSVCILEVYYRHLPLFKQLDIDGS